MRYSKETESKKMGVVYTPKQLADYLSKEMIESSEFDFKSETSIHLLDPAVGSGNLLVSLITKIEYLSSNLKIFATGYETNEETAQKTRELLNQKFPNVTFKIVNADFFDDISLLSQSFDFIIANPPYVRTQILGAEKSQSLSNKFNLKGKVDIYYAFLIYIKKLLKENGIAGYITSNKFLSIKSGNTVRQFMTQNYRIRSIVDFGDTKLFSASVLPCTVIFSSGNTNSNEAKYTSIYETSDAKNYMKRANIFDCLNETGVFEIEDKRKFSVCKGVLGIDKKYQWILSSVQNDKWLNLVNKNTWKHFSDLGKIRVGIKTTADNVFIGNNWIGENSDLELLKPLITHRDSGQIISSSTCREWKVLYPHSTVDGKKIAVDLNDYPKSKKYLEQFYEQLSKRTYLKKANRKWYEIWVPQNPLSWAHKKIVFRDISNKPEFWLDNTGAIVNGDCYWIDINNTVCDDLIYLALAVANSKFIEKYYDIRFNTKLYSGKRRYMAQYVEQFPIPNIESIESQKVINIVKEIIELNDYSKLDEHFLEINELVNNMFLSNQKN